MAFTGNRFEFRAVGSSQSIGGPLVVLNSILAESLSEFADKLDKAKPKTTKDVGKIVQAIIKEVWKGCSAVIFNGDGYSESWHKEAAKRKLPNLRTSADSLPVIKSAEVVALFKKMGVLSPRETHSRYEVYAHNYVTTVAMEASLIVEMARTIIFPAAVRYQSELALSLANLKAVGIETDHKTLEKVTDLIRSLQDSVAELEALRIKEDAIGNIDKHCDFVRDKILPKMAEIRGYVDELEGIVADDLWPLPTYQEMLFIK
jgi:glutamine synthetase